MHNNLRCTLQELRHAMYGLNTMGVQLYDLPKPFLQQLLCKLDTKERYRLRCSCRGALALVDEFCSVYLCIHGRDISLSRFEAIADVSPGVSALCIGDCLKDGPFREVLKKRGNAFSQLSRLVVNYRLSSTILQLAASSGGSLTSITITPGHRKGSRWNFKHCRTLCALQHLTALTHLHITLHTTQQAAQQLGQLTQLKSLKLSLYGVSSNCNSISASVLDADKGQPRVVFTPDHWNDGVAPLTGLTSLQLHIPLAVKRDVGLPNIPPHLQSLQLLLLQSRPDDTQHWDDKTGVTAARQILHNLQPLLHLTRLVIHAESSNDWLAATSNQLTQQGAENLGRLSQLRVLDLSVGHWKLNLLQLQPLSGLCNLTELVVPELVMGYGDEGLDDLLGTRLSREEESAVAAAMTAAAVATAANCSSSSSSSNLPSPVAAAAAGHSVSMDSSPTSPASGSSNSSVAVTRVVVDDSSVAVPLLPQLQVFRCSTLWWRLPLVVLAPRLTSVTYKRIRNLGYGSYVLPDLTMWEQDHALPPEFEEMLQMPGNAFNDILAPQGGFHNNNPAAAAAAGNPAVPDLAGPVQGLADVLAEWQQLLPQQQEVQMAAAAVGAAAAALQQGDVGAVGPAVAAAVQQQQAAAAAAPVLNDANDSNQQQGGQQPQPAAAAAAAAGNAPAPLPLRQAPIHRCYGDVLRGQHHLHTLDVCVTGLCKIMQLSSNGLSGLRELKLHMLGEVNLPAGGLPTLPQLTMMEFYLPDERNWDANYNDDEDIALWQHQHNVQQLVVRGTYHAGGFFAAGHWDIARRCMPLLQCVRFVNCYDLHVAQLQVVIDSKIARVVEICGYSGSSSSDDDDIDHHQSAAAAAAGGDSSSNEDGNAAEQQAAAAAAAGSSGAAAAEQPWSDVSSDSLSSDSPPSPEQPAVISPETVLRLLGEGLEHDALHHDDDDDIDPNHVLQLLGEDYPPDGLQGLGDGMAAAPPQQQLHLAPQELHNAALPPPAAAAAVEPPPPPAAAVGVADDAGMQGVGLDLPGLFVNASGNATAVTAGGKQVVDRRAVRRMAAAAADGGVELRWIERMPAWLQLCQS